jgi:Animal haem peroxidase
MHRPGNSRARARSVVLPRLFIVATAVALLATNVSGAAARTIGRRGRGPAPAPTLTLRSIDGSGNNRAHPTWGVAGTNYLRVAPTNYADGVSTMVSGPNARYISNRIFNDGGQNLFSENNISQWGWAWGQFLDHDMGLRDETPAEDASVPFDATDPLESYSNEIGSIAFDRTPAAPGTGVTTPRQQANSLSSYLDASNVYGVTAARANWLRNPDGTLMLPDDYLPKVGARGDAATAPAMDLMGQLAGNPDDAVVAGDVRANENLGLTAIQTLFAREHNRIVGQLPNSLTGDQKYNIAREVVGAEVQYITYNEFLPALGVRLSQYRGYNPKVNPSISDEFATVGFRAHSMVHGDFDVDFEPGEYSDAQLATFTAEGISVTNTGAEHSLTIPLGLAFGNPDLLPQVGLGAMLAALGGEHEYKNDEQIDNELRSVLFEIPKPGTTGSFDCQDPDVQPDCFTDISDLGVDDVMRGRDHGMPTYNNLRKAYGLKPVASFTQITGESTDLLPAGMTINDPHILDFVQLRDAKGHVIPLSSPDAQEDAVAGVRRSTLAARLKAIYGSVNNVDAFVGMVSEQHIRGTEFGPLQLAMWKDQFTRLRDGDRFFYQNDPALDTIMRRYGVSYRHSLADIIRLDSGATVARDVFHAPPA